MTSRVGISLFAVIYLTHGTLGLNILVLNCQEIRSHFVFLESLTTALLEKGHNIHELVIAQTPKHPNRTTFAIRDKIQHPDRSNLNALLERTDLETAYSLAQFSVQNCENAFESQAAKDLLALARDPSQRPKIDVVVMDYMFGQCLGGFAKEFGNSSIVAVTAFGNPVEVDEIIGAPTFPSFVPHDIMKYSRHDTMTWVERFRNKITYMISYYYRLTLVEATIDRQLREFFGINAATMEEIKRSISVALVNSHPAVQGARPQLPAVIEIGGMHVPPLKEIVDRKLKHFLDSAKDGFILISFGSLLRATSIEPWRRKDLMRAFERLKPLKVVMKYEAPWSTGQDGPLATNVLLSPWLPQSDILGHPNVRLFVTHCGLLSTYEIITRAVPIIAVPFFVDQFLNAKSLADVKVAKILPYDQLKGDTLYNAVNAVLSDKSYTKSVRRLSKILQDQTETPKERAVFWVEFVARHGGAPHLRSPAERLPWIARWMIDDILMLSVLVMALVAAVRYLIRQLCYQIRAGKEQMKEE